MTKSNKRARNRARLHSAVRHEVSKHLSTSNGWSVPEANFSAISLEEADGLSRALVMTFGGLGLSLLPFAIAMKFFGA